MRDKPRDKRELTRRYKETAIPVGIYVIRNTVNGRAFVGGSLNVQAAMNRDRFELERGTHRNKQLLKDWTEFGARCFTFEVIDTIKQREDPLYDYRAELDSALQMWRDEYQSFGEKGYNQR